VTRPEAQGWSARYPDLAGKVAVVTGDSGTLHEIVRCLCANRVKVAVVSADRVVVDALTSAADPDALSLGGVADPARRETWERLVPHVEQRLGPIDIAVVTGAEPARALVTAMLVPDMAARRRGVIIEASIAEGGTDAEPDETPPGVRHRAVGFGVAASAADVAATVVWCASDLLSAPRVSVRLS
jgi:NADP-dependent 3-hydroxy acid dehydrogenase YdfG